MPRFAANLTLMFGEWEFLDRFAAAADAGFDAVEVLFPYAHPPEAVARRLSDNRLELALLNMPPGDMAKGDRGLAALVDRNAEFQESLDLALRYAAATGVKRLHMMAGIASPSDPRAIAHFRASAQFAAERMAEQDITILIEPLNTRDNPGYFLTDFAVAAGLINELAIENLRLQFDIYHRQILHGDVMIALRNLMPIIGHVQTAAVPARNEPGTGELDDARIFAELDRLGYRGFVGCEYRPAGNTIGGLGWFAPYRNSGTSHRH